MNFLRKILKRKKKTKQFSNANAVEAFRHNGKVYYQFEDSFKIPAARAMCALAIYEELRMRCTREYLEKHIRAVELILNPADKRIDLNVLALLNNNLKERLALAPFPDHIYKLASVTFFDENESPYSYDFAYNKRKIDEWRKDPEMLHFFLSKPFKDLLPFGSISTARANSYFEVTQLIDENHQASLQAVLSKQN